MPSRRRPAGGVRPVTPTVIAIDRGGSALRLFAARGGRVIAQWRGPTRPLPALKAWLETWGRRRGWPRADRLIVGSKGIWTRAERRVWARRWSGLAKSVSVYSDVELGHHAVLGTRPGVTLVAGTGSMAIKRDARGRWVRAGGLGPRRGDEGSGWWIGRESLIRAGRAVPADPSPAEVRRVAARARRVLAGRSARDTGLQQDAADRLVALVMSVRPDRRHPVVLAGSLFNNRLFRRRVEKALRERSGLLCRRAEENPARRAAARPGQFPVGAPPSMPRRGARK